jgi:uncharacterized UPF0160 family protein
MGRRAEMTKKTLTRPDISDIMEAFAIVNSIKTDDGYVDGLRKASDALHDYSVSLVELDNHEEAEVRKMIAEKTEDGLDTFEIIECFMTMLKDKFRHGSM